MLARIILPLLFFTVIDAQSLIRSAVPCNNAKETVDEHNDLGLLPIRTFLPTTSNHTATIIFLHGSGSNADECADFVIHSSEGKFNFPEAKVIFPTAPLQPYTPLGGNLSNVWFDRYEVTIEAKENTESVDAVRDEIDKLVEYENSIGIPNERIIIGGISMGGGLAFHAALRWYTSIGGVFTMSSFLNTDSAVYKHLEINKPKTPELLQTHCRWDDLIPLTSGQMTSDRLKSLGVNVNFVIEDSHEHMPNPKLIAILKYWIDEKLPS